MLPYSIHIAWSEDDEAFIARCPELPDLAADGTSYEEAVAELRSVLRMAVEICEEDGKDPPAPRTEPAYSGNLSLRLGSSMHRRVAELAEYEGTSINSLIQTAIAFYLGLAAGRGAEVLHAGPEAGLAALAGGWEDSEELAEAVKRRVRDRRSRQID